MKIAIIGNGQLGSYVAKHWNDDRNDIVTVVDYPEFDITNINCIQDIVSKNDVVINCAAYTAVDKAETDIDRCFAINAFGPKMIVNELKKYDDKLGIFVSSEVVYGSNDPDYAPIVEDTSKTPTCVYSRSKALGDSFIEKCPGMLLLRPGWLFGPDNDHNFIEKISKLLATKNEIKVTNDQIGSLTSVRLMINAMKNFVDSIIPFGTYNIANDGYASRYENAIFVKNIMNSHCDVIPCTSEEFPRPASIAKNSCLNCHKIRQYAQFNIPSWQDDVKAVLEKKM